MAQLLSRVFHPQVLAKPTFRTAPGVTYERQLLHMPDGGVVALDRRVPPPGEPILPETAPIVIFLPGLTGGSKDTYVQHAVHSVAASGFRPFVMNMRGTGDVPVRTAKFFSAAYTEDLKEVVAYLGEQHPDSLLLAAGWSNGGSILANYLGELGEDVPLSAAVVLCCPFNLPQCSVHLSRGLPKAYSWHLGGNLRRIFLNHRSLFETEAARDGGLPYRVDAATQAGTIREFDDAITCVSFGYSSAEEYYAAASSDQRVAAIARPTLVLSARDDPIAIAAAVPVEALEANPNTVLALTPTGGHLGWCCTENGITGAPWTNQVLVEWFKAVVAVEPLDKTEQQLRVEHQHGHVTVDPKETSTEVVR